MTSYQVILISPLNNYEATSEAGKWHRLATPSKGERQRGLRTRRSPVTMAHEDPVPSSRKVGIAPAPRDPHFLLIKPPHPSQLGEILPPEPKSLD